MKTGFKCDVCGKDTFKTEHNLNMHRTACAKKNGVDITYEGPKSDEGGLLDNNSDVYEEITEPTKTDREIILEEVKEFVGQIRGNRINHEQTVELARLYAAVTKKPAQSITCGSCLTHMWETLKLNA